MDRFKFYSYNWAIQDATEMIIDVGDEDSFYPLTNLQHPFSTKVYRSKEGTTISKIIFDLKTSAPLDTCLIKGHALDGFGVTTVKIEASGTLDFNTPLLGEFITIQNKHNIGYLFFTEISARYWRITLEHTGNYVELSNIFLGKATYLEQNNINFGWSMQNVDLSKSVKNRYGQEYTDVLNSIRMIKAQWQYLYQTEYIILNEIFEAHGTHTPLWAIVDTEGVIIPSDDIGLFGGQFKFVDKPEAVNVGFNLYSLEMQLKEAV